MMQRRAGDIKHSLSGYDSGWFGLMRIRSTSFFTIDLKLEVHENDMTWGHRYKKKIRDKQIVDTYVRITHCEF